MRAYSTLTYTSARVSEVLTGGSSLSGVPRTIVPIRRKNPSRTTAIYRPHPISSVSESSQDAATSHADFLGIQFQPFGKKSANGLPCSHQSPPFLLKQTQ